MAGRKFLTKDMLIAALDKGWSVSLTAAHYGMHRKSIDAACERFGIALPLSKYAPTMLSKRNAYWKEVVDAETLKPKGNPIFSCKPGAIERALAKVDHEKQGLVSGKLD
jgi:hypothetical protein